MPIGIKEHLIKTKTGKEVFFKYTSLLNDFIYLESERDDKYTEEMMLGTFEGAKFKSLSDDMFSVVNYDIEYFFKFKNHTDKDPEYIKIISQLNINEKANITVVKAEKINKKLQITLSGPRNPNSLSGVISKNNSTPLPYVRVTVNCSLYGMAETMSY